MGTKELVKLLHLDFIEWTIIRLGVFMALLHYSLSVKGKVLYISVIVMAVFLYFRVHYEMYKKIIRTEKGEK